jgi:hypothetical protein
MAAHREMYQVESYVKSKYATGEYVAPDSTKILSNGSDTVNCVYIRNGTVLECGNLPFNSVLSAPYSDNPLITPCKITYHIAVVPLSPHPQETFQHRLSLDYYQFPNEREYDLYSADTFMKCMEDVYNTDTIIPLENFMSTINYEFVIDSYLNIYFPNSKTYLINNTVQLPVDVYADLMANFTKLIVNNDSRIVFTSLISFKYYITLQYLIANMYTYGPIHALLEFIHYDKLINLYMNKKVSPGYDNCHAFDELVTRYRAAFLYEYEYFQKWNPVTRTIQVSQSCVKTQGNADGDADAAVDANADENLQPQPVIHTTAMCSNYLCERRDMDNNELDSEWNCACGFNCDMEREIADEYDKEWDKLFPEKDIATASAIPSHQEEYDMDAWMRTWDYFRRPNPNSASNLTGDRVLSTQEIPASDAQEASDVHTTLPLASSTLASSTLAIAVETAKPAPASAKLPAADAVTYADDFEHIVTEQSTVELAATIKEQAAHIAIIQKKLEELQQRMKRIDDECVDTFRFVDEHTVKIGKLITQHLEQTNIKTAKLQQFQQTVKHIMLSQ